jgi:hypothetical protein
MSSTGFVQIIEFTTDDIDAVRKIDEEWGKATEGKRTARRQIVTRDRNQPDRYLALVFFDSYQSAMDNSNLEETRHFAEKYSAATRDTTFHDLDVIDDSEL